MEMIFSKFWELLMDREVGHAAGHRVTKSPKEDTTEELN